MADSESEYSGLYRLMRLAGTVLLNTEATAAEIRKRFFTLLMVAAWNQPSFDRALLAALLEQAIKDTFSTKQTRP